MKIVTLGEGMIELSGGIGAGDGRIGYGGDVLNVSVALARMGFAPAFLTALGTDAWSDDLVAAWAAEGVDVSMIARHPTRTVGLYGIHTDPQGERSFTYWRESSATRALFDAVDQDWLAMRTAEADVLFLSGITLSLYDEGDRRRIATIADGVRARGGMVAFDGNYRPRGWSDALAARTAFGAFLGHITIGLPTAGDEALMHDTDESAAAVAERWHAGGAREIVVKLGAEGALVSIAGQGMTLVPTTPVAPIDTSGAGDAFDAGYLAARLSGDAPVAAACFGHRLAGETIRHRGAIPPRDAIVHLRPGEAG